jgi:hydroxylaminobenzene mutase
MGLAAHLEGVMNGILLVALGAIWMEVRLIPSLKKAVFWILLAGTYGNWAVTCLAATLGTAALSPITAVGYRASALQEAAVTGGFVSVGILMLSAAGLVLWGLRKIAAR